jgi:hypothetical protein
MTSSVFKAIEPAKAVLAEEDSADHVCNSILLAGRLFRTLVVLTAVSLALWDQLLPLNDGRWVVHRLPWWAGLPMPVSVVREEPNVVAPAAPTVTAAVVLPPASGTAASVVPEIAESAPGESVAVLPADQPDEPMRIGTLYPLPASEAASHVAPAKITELVAAEPAAQMPAGTLFSMPPSREASNVVSVEIAHSERTDISEAVPVELAAAVQSALLAARAMDEVDEYLWEVYQRAPTKRDSSGDFTWKDPAAAARFGLSIRHYVIGGMDPDFREQLYHAGRSMDAAGIRWSILSGFRDDYRQTIASGYRTSVGKSMHGGSSRTGGYGHGQAVDVAIEDGNPDPVWQWIDRHGAKFGLYRPMPGRDPAHVEARGWWRDMALTRRNARVGTDEETPAPETMTANAGATAEPRADQFPNP